MIASYVKSCVKNIVGNLYLYITETSNIISVTITGGEVTDIQMAAGKNFVQIEADMDSVGRLEESTGIHPKAYNHTIEFSVTRKNIDANGLINQLVFASGRGITAIVVDNNGLCWLVGWNSIERWSRGLYIRDITYTTGKGAIGENGITVTLNSKNECRDIPLSTALNTYVHATIPPSFGNPGELPFTPYTPITADDTTITVDDGTITSDRI
jgi:hypothetical protein